MIGIFQIALTLAVGERALQFEHRDLHWGNVLLSSTKDKDINFVLDGETLSTSSKGIEVICLLKVFHCHGRSFVFYWSLFIVGLYHRFHSESNQ